MAVCDEPNTKDERINKSDYKSYLDLVSGNIQTLLRIIRTPGRKPRYRILSPKNRYLIGYERASGVDQS